MSALQYVVGAHFACLACMQRCIAPACPHCGDRADVVDLDTDVGRRRLALWRTAGESFRAAHASIDPRVLRGMPRGRQAVWIGSRAAFAITFAATLFGGWLPPVRDLSQVAMHVLLGVTFGLVAVGVWLAIVGLIVLVSLGLVGVVAQCVAAMGFVFGALSCLRSRRLSRWAARAWMQATVFATRDVMESAFATVDRLFALRLRIRDVRAHGAGVRGRTLEPVHAMVRDGGSIEIRDAGAQSIQVEMANGERVRVVIDAGAIESDAMRPHDSGDASIPPWAETPASLRHVRLDAGAPVLLLGGRWEAQIDPESPGAHFREVPLQRVLRGTSDAPIVLRTASARQ